MIAPKTSRKIMPLAVKRKSNNARLETSDSLLRKIASLGGQKTKNGWKLVGYLTNLDEPETVQ